MQLVSDSSPGHLEKAFPAPVYDVTKIPEDGLLLAYPPIEQLPEFLTRIADADLLPGCRNFNAAIARNVDGGLLLAYRHERWDAMNQICIARMSADLDVQGNTLLEFPDDGVRGAHWEDPRLLVVGGELLLICAWVKFGTPSICRQRMFRLNPQTLQPEEEQTLPYGRAGEGQPEKNWMPFERLNGSLAIVYAQRPHTVIEHPSSDGHQTPGLQEWFNPGKFLSGRTPPLLLPDGRRFLAFFGGHVKHEYRGARYFIGAYCFEADAPYRVLAGTPEPLGWGSECSPTYHSARPASGHPLCLYPSGAVLAGQELLVSCGVNDSYNVLLRYNLDALLARMRPVDEDGRWVY